MKKKEKILSVSTAALVGLSSIMPASTASAIATGENTVKPSISVNVSEPSSYLDNKWGTAKWDIKISDDTGLAQFVIKSNDQILSEKTYEANTLTDTIHYEMTKEQYEKAKKKDGLLEITFEVKDIDGNIEVYEGTYKTDLEVKDPEITGLNEIGIYKTMPDIVIKNIDENNDDEETDVSKAKIEAEISSDGTVIDTISTTETELKLEKSIFPSDKTEFDIKITVTDEAGNTKTVTKKIIIDATAPLIENVTIDLVNGWAKADSKISAKISDNHNGLTWELKDNKEDKAVAKGEINEAESSLSIPINETTEGDQDYTLTVKDKAGNEATENFKFKADTHVPEITNFALTGDKTYNAFPDFKVEASDHKEGSALPDGTLLNGGSIFVTIKNIATGEFHTVTENNVKELTVSADNLEGLTDGTYQIDAVVTDAAGNSVTEQKSIIVDSKAPSIENVLLSGNQANNWFNGDVTLNFDVLDLQTVKDVKVTLNGEEILKEDVNDATYHGSLNLSKEDLIAGDKNNGEFEIVIEATDNAENTAKTVKTFKADFVAPEISLSGVTEGSFNQVVKKVDITTTDKHISEQGFKIYITVNKDGVDKEYIYDGAEDITLDGDNFADSGIYKVSAYAIDAAGNRNETKEINFTVDNIAPEITDIENEGNLSEYGWFNSDISTSFSVSDNMKNLSKVSVKVNNKEVFSKEFTENESTADLSFKLSKDEIIKLVDENDELFYTFEITDKAGNIGSKTQTLKADFIAPITTITGADEGSFNKEVSNITINTSDRHLDVEGSKVYVTVLKDNEEKNFTYDAKEKIVLEDELFKDSAKYTVSAYAVDAANNKGEISELSFTVDNIAPEINDIVNDGHLSDFGWYNSEIETSFNITDNMKNITDIKVNVNGKEVFAKEYEGTDKEELSFKLSKEDIKGLVDSKDYLFYTFKVTDKAGNVSTKTQSLKADFIAPVSNITGVKEGSFNKQVTDVIIDTQDAHITENGAKVYVTISKDGKNETLTFEGVSKIKLDDKYFKDSAKYKITTYAVDAADNRGEDKSISFVVDNIAPTISNIKNSGHLSKKNWYNTAITTDFEISDNMKNIVSAKVTVNNKTVLSEKYSDMVQKDSLSVTLSKSRIEELVNDNGTLNYEFTVTDAAGNVTVKEQSLKADFTAPVLTINGINEGTHYQNLPSISVDNNEKFFKDSEFTVKIERDGKLVSTKTFEGLADALINSQYFGNDGDYVITVTGKDGADNVAKGDKVSFVKDTTAPVLEISGIENGTFNPNPVTLTFTASERYYDTTDVTIHVKRTLGGSVNEYTTNFNMDRTTDTTTLNFSETGTYEIYMTAIDEAGNEAVSRTATFTVDTVNPVIDISSPTIVTYGESSAITISATDDYLDNVSVVLYKDGQQVRAESSASGAITFENLAQTRDNDGRYNFTVTATDKAGNVTTEERDFIVNRFGAKYTTNAFDDNLVGYHKELPKALIIDANSPSDIVSGAVNVKRDGESINVGSVKSNRTNMEFEITPEDVSKEGIYFVTATATDNVGNISNSEDQIGDIRFVIDKTKPTISHNIEDEVYKASSKEFDIAFKDNILLKNATIKVNGKVVEEFKDIDSTSLNYTLTLNKGIKQKVEIETEDMAGNIKTTTNKVTVSDSMFDYLLYNHTLYWIIGGIATLGIAGLIFALKRRKDKK